MNAKNYLIIFHMHFMTVSENLGLTLELATASLKSLIMAEVMWVWSDRSMILTVRTLRALRSWAPSVKDSILGSKRIPRKYSKN